MKVNVEREVAEQKRMTVHLLAGVCESITLPAICRAAREVVGRSSTLAGPARLGKLPFPRAV